VQTWDVSWRVSGCIRDVAAAGTLEESGGKARVCGHGHNALQRHAKHLQDEHQGVKNVVAVQFHARGARQRNTWRQAARLRCRNNINGIALLNVAIFGASCTRM
jgi:hypothetical protein